ncbi:hypothetical protein [Mesorhizobium sp. WSM2240]|uniref:site-specific DNA-methyltransferase (cytosine-N(4)-specific) n=3 Tax=unclassified Mesorhizobium TaxID=325217 RepID=A0AAU8D8W6_9HYPH
MAPEIALERILKMNAGQVVLDPMVGSGMVLAVAARNGIRGIGVDLDPLARLVSRTCSTRIDDSKARSALVQLISRAQMTDPRKICLSWMDDDKETLAFVRYWFGAKQIAQLRALSYHLIERPLLENGRILRVLMVSLSRLIISKEPKASLARDTAHSRPHRTIKQNEFDIFDALPDSLEHVLSALESDKIAVNSRTFLGDGRKLANIRTSSVDAVVTSPPYLNAIDYMRGHKFSLIWFGYRVEDLRRIRTLSIGSERSANAEVAAGFELAAKELALDRLSSRHLRVLARYFEDLSAQLRQTKRVLKLGGSACYVIGNSEIRGISVANNELLKRAGLTAGLSVLSETVRKIPDKNRYLPLPSQVGNALGKRMRTEHVLEFIKAA